MERSIDLIKSGILQDAASQTEAATRDLSYKLRNGNFSEAQIDLATATTVFEQTKVKVSVLDTLQSHIRTTLESAGIADLPPSRYHELTAGSDTPLLPESTISDTSTETTTRVVDHLVSSSETFIIDTFPSEPTVHHDDVDHIQFETVQQDTVDSENDGKVEPENRTEKEVGTVPDLTDAQYAVAKKVLLIDPETGDWQFPTQRSVGDALAEDMLHAEPTMDKKVIVTRMRAYVTLNIPTIVDKLDRTKNDETVPHRLHEIRQVLEGIPQLQATSKQELEAILRRKTPLVPPQDKQAIAHGNVTTTQELASKKPV